MTFFKGMCYQPFPPGYDPSIANHTWIYFGSDIAYAPMEPLWGTEFRSQLGSGCAPASENRCRDDLDTLKALGVTLLRLYDWEPRNIHQGFLDRCTALDIKVLAPVSNYFVRPDEGLPRKYDNVSALIDSFSNAERTDYHEAIAAIIIGNEPRLNNFSAENCVEFTVAWAEGEDRDYNSYRRLPIGHPVDFHTYGGKYPCWGFWDSLLSGLRASGREDLLERIILAPQTYNVRSYLFDNAEGSGKGYVDLTHAQYGKPILFTEIGMDRTKADFEKIVEEQLSGSIGYGNNNPEILLGVCFFQFADKAWKPKGDPEGSYGIFSHGPTMFTVEYGPEDFTHWDVEPRGDQTMAVDRLVATPLYDVVRRAYEVV